MHIVDQSVQRMISRIQCVFWGALSLMTFKKADGINHQLKKAEEAFREASAKDRI